MFARRFCLLFAALCLLAAVFVSEQSFARERAPEISVLTFGPGDHPFTKFGHIAILVRGPEREAVYNFGTFEFGPGLLAEFSRGRLTYWLSVTSLASVLDSYRADNRSVIEQELDLTAEQAHTLASSLEKNARPENRAYHYDYYLDNCSTRVRDAIDRVLGGALKEASATPAEATFRQHTLRAVGDSPGLFFALDLALGPRADSSVQRWDEMFLPDVVRQELRALRVERAGRSVPVVRKESVLFEARRPPLPAKAPTGFWLSGLLGAGLGGLFWFFGRAAPKTRSARLTFAGLLGLLGLVAGLLGSVLVFFWAYTDHEVAHRNLNLLLLPPYALGFVPLAVFWARGSARARAGVRMLAAACVLGALAATLVQGALQQDASRLAALCLPLWVGLASGMLGRQPMGAPVRLAGTRVRDGASSQGRSTAETAP